MHACTYKACTCVISFFSSSDDFFEKSLMYLSLPSMREMRPAKSFDSREPCAPCDEAASDPEDFVAMRLLAVLGAMGCKERGTRSK